MRSARVMAESPSAKSRGRAGPHRHPRRDGAGAARAMSNMRGKITLHPEAARRGRPVRARCSPARAGSADKYRHRLDPAAAVARRLSRARRSAEGEALDPRARGLSRLGGRRRVRALPRADCARASGPATGFFDVEDDGGPAWAGGDRRAGAGRDGGGRATASCACRGGWCSGAPRAGVLVAALGAVPAQPHLRAAAAPGLSAAPARRWCAGRRTGTSTCTSG